MNRINKTIFFVLLFTLVFGVSLFAQNKAVIVEMNGKVEVSVDGSWKPATQGMTVPLNATISTGFNSSAKLDLGDSIVGVKQLSRLKIQELDRTEGKAKTTLYLASGKVTADVKSSSKLKHDFQFKSPIATASVRGTELEFTPTELTVTKGSVSFSNNYGQTQLIIKGEEAVADSNSGVQNKKETQYSGNSTNSTQNPSVAYEPEDSKEAPNSPLSSKGKINISVSYD